MDFVPMYFVDAVVHTLASTVKHVSQELQKAHGVGGELEKLKKSVSSIQGVLSDAQQSEDSRKFVKNSLSELREVAYQANDILDDFATEQQRKHLIKYATARNFLDSVNPKRILFRRDIYDKIQEIEEKLDKIAQRSPLSALTPASTPRYESQRTHISESTSVSPPCVLGRKRDKQKIKELLMQLNGQTDSAASVISIFGKPGIGKTTLAQELYDDETVKKHFELRIWVHVSHNFNLKRITRCIIESIDKSKCDLDFLDNLQQEVREKVSRRRYLLVLDDVWEESQEWERLKRFLYSADEGSKILVTTKSEQVAASMAPYSPPYRLDGLSTEDCWSLIRQEALSRNPTAAVTLDRFQSHVAQKCRGSPMAAKALGQRLAREADKNKWEKILTSQLWEFSGPGSSNSKSCPTMEALSPSYQVLPHHLKPCFAYLSVIPKEYELERDFIIQLWMAQSFIRPRGTEQMEDVGNDYIDDLKSSSFLQYSHFDHESRRKRYVMDDVFHEFARHVAAEEFCVIEPGTDLDLSASVRHLSVNYEEFRMRDSRGGDMYKELYECGGLQSLLVIGSSTRGPTMVVPDDLAKRLSSLRTLMLSNLCLIQLPESIGDLRHLRCLQLQNTDIKRLPESVSYLYNLQTLGLRNCYHLKELPKDTRNLRNLRHLDLHLDVNSQGKLRCMPPEIGLLTHLRTLNKFVVNERHECGLSQLENLNDLRNELLIERLDQVFSREDAKNAKLSSKKHIRRLELTWNYSNVTDACARSEGYNSRDNILKYLTPHPEVREIRIVGYGGTSLPTWMGNSSLYNLETVWISKSYSCMKLPTLGRLPKLKYLFLEEMHGLNHLNCSSFCGKNERQFPMLEKLHLENMSALQEWSGDYDCALPSLRELTIKKCPALHQLRHELPSLTKLVIEASPSFAGLPYFPKLLSLEVKTNDDWIWRSWAAISLLPSLTLSGLRRADLPCEIGSYHASIRRLEISYCSQLKFIPDGWLPARLSHFVIRNCPVLQNLPAGMTWLTGLEDLEIEKCEQLKHLPVGLGKMNSLAHLEISDCPGLSWLQSERLPSKLQFLSLSNCHELIQKLQDQGLFNRRQDLQVWINGKLVT